VTVWETLIDEEKVLVQVGLPDAETVRLQLAEGERVLVLDTDGDLDGMALLLQVEDGVTVCV